MAKQIFLITIIVWLVSYVVASKSKSSIAIPKGKKKSGGFFKPFASNSLFGRLARELKLSFCSELEGLTLQMTRPNDKSILITQFDMITACVNEEYEDPEVTINLLAKFSRKLQEPNVYTKIKTLICLHQMMLKAHDKAKQVLKNSFVSLKSEHDHKVNAAFFSLEKLDECANMASNVAEVETAEITREYSKYVYDYIELRGEKVNVKKCLSQPKMIKFLKLLDRGDKVKEICEKSGSPIAKQCADAIISGEDWLMVTLKRCLEIGIEDDATKEKVATCLDSRKQSQVSALPSSSKKVKVVGQQKAASKSKITKSITATDGVKTKKKPVVSKKKPTKKS